jgi:AcrR family transcriptional regulator
MTTETLGKAAKERSTKESLLAAAERLFARQGIARSSLRAITQEAGANLASVNYHFGSKGALVRAVFSRHLQPLNRQRLELLERCESTEGAPQLESIVHAFVAPVLRLRNAGQPGQRDLARLMGRTFSEPGDQVRRIVLEEFAEVIDRFTTALARALPEVPPEDLFWRFHFMVGAMVHTAAHGNLAGLISGGLCDPDEVERLTRHLVGFLAAGLRAASSGEWRSL